MSGEFAPESAQCQGKTVGTGYLRPPEGARLPELKGIGCADSAMSEASQALAKAAAQHKDDNEKSQVQHAVVHILKLKKENQELRRYKSAARKSYKALQGAYRIRCYELKDMKIRLAATEGWQTAAREMRNRTDQSNLNLSLENNQLRRQNGGIKTICTSLFVMVLGLSGALAVFCYQTMH